MKRTYGTCVFGVRTPIIEKGDNLVRIVVDSTIATAGQVGLTLSDNDIVGVTEAVVAISQGNYINIKDIATDIGNKFHGEPVGIVHPIFSRNRFQNILKGIAGGAEKVYVLLANVDEQGNALFNKQGRPEHPITKQNYIELYRSMGDNIQVIVSDNPTDILKETRNIIVGSIHNRDEVKELFQQNGANKVITLADIMNKPIEGSGYNPQYGVMGSNFATAETLKLFPRDCDEFVHAVQQEFFNRIKVKPEVMVFGDGAYKDPATGIWELADPVVSPGFTTRLGHVGRGDTKLKAIADEQLSNMSKQEKEREINRIIAENQKKSGDGALGTTPRTLVNLVGSMMDLASGSGNKGTPCVLVHGYFDTRADEDIKMQK